MVLVLRRSDSKEAWKINSFLLKCKLYQNTLLSSKLQYFRTLAAAKTAERYLFSLNYSILSYFLWDFVLTSVTLSLDDNTIVVPIFGAAKGGGLIYRK